jgi:hypothetical protein
MALLLPSEAGALPAFSSSMYTLRSCGDEQSVNKIGKTLGSQVNTAILLVFTFSSGRFQHGLFRCHLLLVLFINKFIFHALSCIGQPGTVARRPNLPAIAVMSKLTHPPSEASEPQASEVLPGSLPVNSGRRDVRLAAFTSHLLNRVHQLFELVQQHQVWCARLGCLNGRLQVRAEGL